jgi:Flp pilus assembly pilin Flp
MNKRELQRGATMVEYAVAVSLICLATVASVTYLGSRIRGTFVQIILDLATSGETGGGGEGEGDG